MDFEQSENESLKLGKSKSTQPNEPQEESVQDQQDKQDKQNQPDQSNVSLGKADTKEVSQSNDGQVKASDKLDADKSKEVKDTKTAKDSELTQAKQQTEKTVDKIKAALNKKEVKEDDATKDKSALLIKLAVGFSGAAMLFSFIGMFGGGGVSESQLQGNLKRVIDQVNHVSMTNAQAAQDDRADTQSLLKELMSATQKLNNNIMTMNSNIKQNYDNLSSRLSASGSSDNSGLKQSITELNTAIKQLKSSGYGGNAKDQSDATRYNTTAQISYVGNSPNGAIIKVTDKGKTDYETVNAGDYTKYGLVSYQTPDKLVINNVPYILLDNQVKDSRVK